MKNIQLKTLNISPLVEQKEDCMVQFPKELFESRVTQLTTKLKQNGFTHAIVYGDREHFANIESLIGYDPRFEESLLIVDQNGTLTILIGNEGWSYADIIPIPVKKVLYQNFSLQGQPRDQVRPLETYLYQAGLDKQSKIGVIGYKYFEQDYMDCPESTLDIPVYVYNALCKVTEKDNITNFTWVMTHPINGLRVCINTALELASYEYAANKASNCVIRMLRSLAPGVTELEHTRSARFDATPTNMYPLLSFGDEHNHFGLMSPTDRVLCEGEPVCMGYGIRGANVARAGLAAYDNNSLAECRVEAIEVFYKPFFSAIAYWLSSLKIGASCGDIYAGVMDIIGNERFGVALNPGHNITADEWTNTPFYAGSRHRIVSGLYLQSDIIAVQAYPYLKGICEDGVVIADEILQQALHEQFPSVFARIMRRRDFMRNVIGIPVDNCVLPLSNLTGIYNPFMVDIMSCFVLE